MSAQPDFGRLVSGDSVTDARLAAAYAETRQSVAGNRFNPSTGVLEPPADLEAARGESKTSYSKCTFCGDPHPNHPGRDCPHKAKTTIPLAPGSGDQRVPQLPDLVDEDAVCHHHNHEYAQCTVTHHHHYAGTASHARSYRSQDHGPKAGPGPPQPVSGRGPMASTSGSPVSGYGFSGRVLTPFELANPSTCLHRDTRASTRTRSRSQGPASRTSSRSRNDPDSPRRSHPVS